ncbi:GIN domain-containing protein [Sphingomonas sp. Leaf343]|uniref:GIN domain-containing protein n=1 Tax=Sphingomonas sp. Leaf343 TaxID=1736345 RepID=UPI0006FE42C7|nr:DUF2807 domain-containing protein [Sphingomonas sp. Leaf343]KQR88033.1 hypothetical protein ASG07_04105 [Sphingomonas sp. Leaf343]
MKRLIRWSMLAVVTAGFTYAGLASRGPDDAVAIDRTVTGTAMSRVAYAAVPFSRILLDGPYTVVARVGTSRSVTAYGTDATLKGLALTVVDGELRIRRSSDGPAGDHSLRLVVTTPELDGVQLYGAGRMQVEDARGTDFHALAAGSGQLRLVRLIADDADLTAMGPARIAATGRVAKLTTAELRGGHIDDSAIVRP